MCLQFYERYFKQKEKEKEWRHIKEWIELTAENVEPRYFVPQQYIVSSLHQSSLALSQIKLARFLTTFSYFLLSL